jgi:hypothetical protein
MPKRVGLLGFVCFAALFLITNRAAYKGYFQDDELDNLAWTPRVRPVTYLEAALSPRFQPDNFRPVGHFYFYLAERLFGLDFPKWVALVHAMHLLNVWLLWMLARRLGSPPLAAAAACVFFGLHMALFDALWKPMFIFDVLCATFCLLSLLLYLERRWLLAFAAFWLAYKSKELAVMLPLVLAAAELWFGKGDCKRRGLRLAPFFAVSLSFGLQGILLNPNVDNPYAFHFTPAAVAQTSVFYAACVFLAPYAGFALPLAALVWRRRRVWFGLTAMALLILPLLFLPGRLFGAYCYVPFTGLALAFSGVAEAIHPAGLAAFFLLWTPLELHQLRHQQRATLALDDQVREWVTSVASFARSAPRPAAIIYRGRIPGFADWGERGAIHYLFHDPGLKTYSIDEPAASALLQAPHVVLLSWNGASHKLGIGFGMPAKDAAYLLMDGIEPPGQLGEGWYPAEGDYRWSEPRATAQLVRPSGAARFELRVLVDPPQITALGRVTVGIALDGLELEPRAFTHPGWQTAAWDLPSAPAGPVHVTLTAIPPFHSPPDVRVLGVAVGGLGFSAAGR